MSTRKWVFFGFGFWILGVIFGFLGTVWFSRITVEVQPSGNFASIEFGKVSAAVLFRPQTMLMINEFSQSPFKPVDLEADMPKPFTLSHVLKAALTMNDEARQRLDGRAVCILPTIVTLTTTKLKIRFEGWLAHINQKTHQSYRQESEPVGSMRYLIDSVYWYQPYLESLGYSKFTSFGYDLHLNQGALLYFREDMQKPDDEKPQRRIRVFGIVPSTFFIYTFSI